MRRGLEQQTELSDYQGYDIALHVKGPVDEEVGEGFTDTISISKDGEDGYLMFKESDVAHKTYEDAVRIGTTIARQKIDEMN
jgi:hypothetical protein